MVCGLIPQVPMIIPSTFCILHLSIQHVLLLDLAALVDEVAVSGLAIAALSTFSVYYVRIVQIDLFNWLATYRHSKSLLSLLS